jgi:hypothetical protein
VSGPAPDDTVINLIIGYAREGGWRPQAALPAHGQGRYAWVRGRDIDQSVLVTIAPTSGQLVSAVITVRRGEAFTVSGHGTLSVVRAVLRREWI